MLNIEQYRKIIPAQKLLGSVRVALLPDGLKDLFSGHMHTREMPTESLEEALLPVCFLFASQVCRITGLLLSP